MADLLEATLETSSGETRFWDPKRGTVRRFSKRIFFRGFTIIFVKTHYFSVKSKITNHLSLKLIDLPLIFHRFGDGLVIAFSSFLHSDIAPLPNLENHVFEQHYGVLHSKSSFQAWIIPGLSQDYPRIAPGLSQDYPRIIP